MLLILISVLIITLILTRRWQQTKYLIIIELLIWCFLLQTRLSEPGAVGKLIIEIILILASIITYLLLSIKYRKENELKKENEFLQEQIARYENEVDISENVKNNISRIKHDLKNQLIGLEALLENEQYDDLKKAIEDTLGELYVNTYISSGNSMLDNLLNYKINYARNRGIAVEVNIQVPRNEKLNTIPVIVAVGNMLDNAIEAVMQVNKGRQYIDINIERRDNRIFITVENPFQGVIKTNKSGMPITTKNNSECHGLGIKSIVNAMKDKGDFVYNVEENVFSATLILY
ncbi:MAG: GHKL domain-containing protein [Acetatifactor sp.]|nr:GHKL domain-containing protein [Acetatifactor sp.]